MFAKRTLFLGLLGLVFVVSSCATGPSSKESSLNPSQYKTPEMFKEIPADTPYVWAQFTRPPREIVENQWKVFEKFNAEIDTESKILGKMLERLKKADHLGEFFKNEVGLHPRGFAACYGIGLFPVCRADVTDAENLRRFLDEIEEKTEAHSIRKERYKKEYRIYRTTVGETIVRITDETFFIGFAPSKEKLKPVRSHILGETDVKKSIADSRELHRVAKKHRFEPYGIGHVDSEKLLNELTIRDGEDQLSKHCRTELDGLVDRFPGIAYGSTELTRERSKAEIVFEVNNFAEEFEQLSSAAPAYASKLRPGYLLEIGLGFDMDEFLNLGKKWANQIIESPYRCKHLQALNQGANDFSKFNPPGSIRSLQGAYLGLKSVNFAKKAVEGIFLVKSSQPGRILGQLEMAFPPLRKTNIPQDGTPVQLKGLGAISPNLKSARVAMKNNYLGFSVGGKMNDKLKAYVGTQKQNKTPALALRYDPLAFTEKLLSIGQQMGADMSDVGGLQNLPGIVGLTLAFKKHGVALGFSHKFTDVEKGDEMVRKSTPRSQ